MVGGTACHEDNWGHTNLHEHYLAELFSASPLEVYEKNGIFPKVFTIFLIGCSH
jgi:hypothetical protein